MYVQKYLKWCNTVVGIIKPNNSVQFIVPNLNPIVSIYTKGKTEWSESEFKEFLRDRLPSKNRRDIEKILFRCGLADYDEIKLAGETRAFNAKDLFWISFNKNELMEDILKGVLEQIFIKKLDIDGGTIVSPDGLNIKRYGVSNGNYGIYKKRLHPLSTDVESEVAVYGLSRLLGVKCCQAWLVKDANEVVAFSKFEYNFANEYIVHARNFFADKERLENEYENLVNKFPLSKNEIRQMILLDFITRQTDRHLSNVAMIFSSLGMEFYSLYDNGRSLFYEDSEEFISKAINNIPLYSSEFGPVGTYFDYVQEIGKEANISKLINIDISKDTIYRIYANAGLRGYKLEGSTEWAYRALQVLKMV